MRMRDLEKASGIGRETIRFYIREGLLPEPVRTARNAALYDEEHLARLLAIRRLREDRYLPLGVIRVLLDAPPESGWDSPDILPHVDRLLRARLELTGEREPALAILADAPDPAGRLAELVEAGAIDVAADGTVSPRDARILRLLQDLGRLGFTRERGYAPEGLKRYVSAMRWLAETQVREFFRLTGPHVDETQAADMAERGLGYLIELMGELFMREVLAGIAARRARLAAQTERREEEGEKQGPLGQGRARRSR
ncbi:MerR family transcriptional regulator [Thermaurantiacus sp.]